MLKRFLLVILFLTSFPVVNAQAESEADCAIWICLPGGFPAGCEAAYSAFVGRLKHARPPLPDLSACSTGPNGEHVSGSYDLGYELYESCKEGYTLKGSGYDFGTVAKCFPDSCMQGNFVSKECPGYDAIRRQKPSYVKMWVDGQYLGQFWY